MSNTGDFFQKLIDQSKGKTTGGKMRVKRRNRGGKFRKKQQIIFEKSDQLIKDAGGQTSPITKMKGFGKKGLSGKRVKRFLRREDMIKHVLEGGGRKGTI